MPVNWHLRAGREHDIRAMYLLDLVCFEQPFRFDLRSMRQFVVRRGAIVLVAENEGDLAGFIIVHLEGTAKRLGYVVTLDVAPEFRRLGLARSLVEAVERKVAESGATGMALHVYVGNAAAVAFYERMGYAPGELEPEFYGPGLDGLACTKPLS